MQQTYANDEAIPLRNSLNMSLVHVKSGTFVMGSPYEEEYGQEDEVPHEVTLSGDFYIGATEVTQKQYTDVVGKDPSHFQKRVIRKSDSTSYPVENVTWDEADAFCKQLSEKAEEKAAGRIYRLPTEAEWEYACRAGTKTAYFFGTDSVLLGEFAWFTENSQTHSHPVAALKPNPWGLYDVHGNVSEWCSDWYGKHRESAAVDPIGPSSGKSRVIRGGSWSDPQVRCRSAYRRLASSLRLSHRSPAIGFRVVMTEVPQGVNLAEGKDSESAHKLKNSEHPDRMGKDFTKVAQITFMDISSLGETVTYVIDTSNSMDGNRLKLAQNQLKASLRLLQPNQKFSIILYNEATERLKPRRRAEEEFYAASDVNIRLMEDEIDQIESSLGTSHMPALLEALIAKPDVIYFLTDGAEPELSPSELREIARKCAKTTIHVVQFGEGTLTNRETSWLERLARQSNGEFRHLNVKNR